MTQDEGTRSQSGPPLPPDAGTGSLDRRQQIIAEAPWIGPPRSLRTSVRILVVATLLFVGGFIWNLGLPPRPSGVLDWMIPGALLVLWVLVLLRWRVAAGARDLRSVFGIRCTPDPGDPG